MIGSVGKPTVHTETCAKNWIKSFHKSVQSITLLLLRCLVQSANQDPKIERLWLDKSSPVFVKAESEAIELEAKAKKHKDLTIDRAILLMKHLAPRLTGCDKNKVADVISFLTGFDSEAIR